MDRRHPFTTSRVIPAFALALAACGGATEAPAGAADSGVQVPVKDAGEPPPGRPTATTCPASAAPTGQPLPDGGLGPCAFDSDCVAPGVAQGKCEANPDGGAKQCDYDQCLQDSDCASIGVCGCQVVFGAAHATINVCLPSGCHVDADCGNRGPCSPTVTLGCGRDFGIEGYYCHTAADQCATDADCGNTDGAYTPYCAYDTTVGHWVCGTGVCVG